MDLLKELTETNGAPGFEKAIRAIMKREINQTGSNLLTDHLGSIFGEKKGAAQEGPKILLAGHMDEVGFMVSEITKDGYLRFVPLGGWWSQVLLAQRVQVVTKNRTFTGVVGSKAPHVLQPEERNRVYPMREMFIDIGANDKDQVKQWGIKVGDPILPICPFELMPNNDTILAKALDNRAGCYTAIQVLKQLHGIDHPNTVYSGATVQEEVGLRGALTAPYIMDPDVAIALDVGVAEDVPGGNANKAKLGEGPLITFLDSSMIPHTSFRDLIIEVAEKNNIPYQVDVMLGGGTDAGKFHLFKKGIPSIVVGVAARYIHSHTSMISKSDLENSAKLVVELIKVLDKEKLQSLIEY